MLPVARRSSYAANVADSDDEKRLKIGQLAERLDLNARTIRFYEQVGVLPEPTRNSSGYRLYSDEDEERLRFVKNAQRLGLTLGEIKEVLAFRDNDEPPCRYVAEVTISRCIRFMDQPRRTNSVASQSNRSG